MMTGGERHYRARWLLDGRGNAAEGATLSVHHGRIVSVSTHKLATDTIDLGDVAIVPGFVNAHTHLDLSDLSQPIAHSGSFADWLERVIRHRGAATGTQQGTGTQRGTGTQQGAGAGNTCPSRPPLREAAQAMVAAGTTLVGDISADGSSPTIFEEVGLPAIVWHEVLGLRPERYEPLWQHAVQEIESGNRSDRHVTHGISPHAPYSTALEIYRRAGALDPAVPLATHWLESAEEVELLTRGTGPMARFLARIGAWTEPWSPTLDPWSAYFGSKGDAGGGVGGGNKSARWVLVHCNYVTDRDIERMTRPELARHLGGVVYCPRTHAYFGHAPHPFGTLRQAGIPVALGTDSLASNPDLSVFEEARFLAAKHPALDPRALLGMLTQEGARVLGRSDQAGTLEAGKRADLVAVDLGGWRGAIHEGIFAPQARIVGTMIGGEWLSGGGAD